MEKDQAEKIIEFMKEEDSVVQHYFINEDDFTGWLNISLGHQKHEGMEYGSTSTNEEEYKGATHIVIFEEYPLERFRFFKKVDPFK